MTEKGEPLQGLDDEPDEGEEICPDCGLWKKAGSELCYECMADERELERCKRERLQYG